MTSQIYYMRLKHIYEDLDDRDEFGQSCVVCNAEIANNRNHNAPLLDQDDFHKAHIAAQSVADNTDIHQDRAKYGYYGVGTTMGTYKAVMAQHGYMAQYINGSLCWSKTMKEDLDDKDEFYRSCMTCRIHGRDIEDTEGFHEAHTAASARASLNAPGLYEAEMRRNGWVWFKGTWFKKDDTRIKAPNTDKPSARL